MLAAAGLLDLIIPRGGKSLVERVQREARVPVLAHAEGLCHTYVHAAADPAMARAHRRQRQDAPHRRLRRHRDAADRPRDRARAAARAHRRPARAGLRLPRRCRRPRHRARPAGAQPRPISTPNGSTPSSRSPWWTASMRRWRTSPATAASTPTPSSPRTPRRPSASCAGLDSAVGAMERLDAVLRRRRIRLRRRDRHRHRPHPCARPGRAGAANHLPLRRPRHRAGASLNEAATANVRPRLRARPPRAPPTCAPPDLNAPLGLDPVPRFGDRRRARIGLLGGSFNPAHQGHRHVAELALRRCGLDQVWLLVSPGNPLKPRDGMAPLSRAAGLGADRRQTGGGLSRAARGATRHAVHPRYVVPAAAAVPRVAFSGSPVPTSWRNCRNGGIGGKSRAWCHSRCCRGPGYNHGALAGPAASVLRGARRPARAGSVLRARFTTGLGVLAAPQDAASASAIRAPAPRDPPTSTSPRTLLR